MPSLFIPDRHRKAFEDLATASVDFLRTVATELRTAEASCSRGAVVDAFLNAGMAPLSAEGTTDALLSLGGVLNTNRGQASAVIRDLQESLGREFDQAVVDVLMSPVITRTAKVYDLYSAFPYCLHGVRLVTDVRPVFDDVIGEMPAGCFVVHQMELETWRNGELDKTYITIDDKDLDTLLEEIARAKQKGAAARQAFLRAGVADYGPETS